MANVKYCLKHFNPNPTQQAAGMTHSVHAAAVVDNTITTQELAHKVHVEGSISSDFEIEAILKVAARVILSECKENNRVQLDTGDGVLVTFSPKVSGSISDKDVLANQDKYPGKTVAEEDMLTADLLQWTLKAEVGQKFCKQFAQQKHAQKVSVTNTANVIDDDEVPGTQNGGTENGNGGGNNNPNEEG